MSNTKGDPNMLVATGVLAAVLVISVYANGVKSTSRLDFYDYSP